MFRPSREQIERIAASPFFDAGWYARTYPDVAPSGLTPAEHYAWFGRLLQRDPSNGFDGAFYIDTCDLAPHQNPVTHRMYRKKRGTDRVNPERVLLAAANAGYRTGWDRALELARDHLPADHIHTLHALRANRALSRGDAEGWLAGLNAFLAHWKTDPLLLKDGDTPVTARLRAAPRAPVADGPKVSVLMPAWNAEDTIAMAAKSILAQTWRNLELIVVDDCSTDGTWAALQALAARDDRLRIHRNPANAGPYVSKNVALTMAEGAWITGHDADDLALPDRLERQVAFATEDGARSPASLSYMVRLSPGGMFSHLGRVSDFSPDGVARLASISCLFRTDFLRDRLGFWDSVRFGADTEMIARAERLAGKTFRTVPILSMLCLDVATSLTNHPELGVDRSTGMSPVRRAYREAWVAWHDAHDDAELRLPFPQDARRYRAPDQMIVSPSNLRETLSAMP